MKKNEENKEKNCQHKIQHVTVQSDTHELNSSIYWGGMRYWNPLNDFYNSTQKKIAAQRSNSELELISLWIVSWRM